MVVLSNIRNLNNIFMLLFSQVEKMCTVNGYVRKNRHLRNDIVIEISCIIHKFYEFRKRLVRKKMEGRKNL